MSTIAEILKKKIGNNGKSKTYVALQLGVTEKTVENYMNGKREPKQDALKRLAEMLDFSLSELSEQNVLKEDKKAGAGTKTQPSTSDPITEALEIIRSQNEFLQQMLNISLADLSRELKNGQSRLGAEIRGYGQYLIQDKVNWDQAAFLKEMARVGSLIGANLQVSDGQDTTQP